MNGRPHNLGLSIRAPPAPKIRKQRSRYFPDVEDREGRLTYFEDILRPTIRADRDSLRMIYGMNDEDFEIITNSMYEVIRKLPQEKKVEKLRDMLEDVDAMDVAEVDVDDLAEKTKKYMIGDDVADPKLYKVPRVAGQAGGKKKKRKMTKKNKKSLRKRKQTKRRHKKKVTKKIVKKSTRKIKSHKKSSKRSKTHRRTRKSHYGGKVMGRGAFGTVFAEPRIPCERENADEVAANNEVSKVFSNDYSAAKEYSVLKRLERVFGPDYKNILEPYVILPSKICDTNTRELDRRHRYREPKWSEYYGQDLYESYFGRERDEPAYKQIIYPKANNSVQEPTESIKKIDDLVTHFRKLYNVCKGIELLQTNGMVHGDLKFTNVVEVDDVYKIIDMADVESIDKYEDIVKFLQTYEYFTWPTIVAWLIYIGNKYNSNPELRNYSTDGKYEINNAVLLKAYDSAVGFNDSNLVNLTGLTTVIQKYEGRFDEEIDALISEFNDIMISQKVFTPVSIREEIGRLSFPEFMKLLKKELRENLNSGKEPEVVTLYNEIVRSFSTIDEIREDLLKRVDIYSLGIMIIQGINHYLMENVELDYEKQLIIKAMVGIAKMCCVQNERVVDITDVSSEWKRVSDLLR